MTAPRTQRRASRVAMKGLLRAEVHNVIVNDALNQQDGGHDGMLGSIMVVSISSLVGVSKASLPVTRQVLARHARKLEGFSCINIRSPILLCTPAVGGLDENSLRRQLL